MSLVEMILCLIFFPGLTVAFVRCFWTQKWINRENSGVLYIWGVLQIVWFVGVLLVLPMFYWRASIQSPPDIRILIPFGASILFLFFFCKESIKILTEFIKKESFK